MLLAFAYWLVFGLLLSTREGTTNYVAFLSSGIFTFVFISSTLTAGSKSIVRNTGLIRALRFPRCLMPLSVALAVLVVVIPAFVVLLFIVVVTVDSLYRVWLYLSIDMYNYLLI